ncbi:MAG TPA: F0F1 ATP synthase subunit delta [Xanthobacteraceae bacterium]|nr:F0F1 ATP synthase subunit delta [Xanthobacteraceae bacterium]
MVADEPIVSGMAGRYATALYELALEQKSLDSVRADLDRFDALVEDSKDLQRLVKSPVFTAEEQKNALAAILEKAEIGGLAAKFLGIVAEKRRLFAVGQMIRVFRALVARHKGETRAEVTVAEPLPENHLNALKAALMSATLKKDVMLDVRVDPTIIGGLIVKLGSRMVDASLKTKLNSIKLAMKEVQ